MSDERHESQAGGGRLRRAYSALSDSQMRILRRAGSAPNGHIIVAGNKQAPHISAARALCRKGLMLEWRTSHYAITDSGRAFLAPNESSAAALNRKPQA